MNIKLTIQKNKIQYSVLTAQVAVSPGETEGGAPFVLAAISQVDAFGILEGVGRLVLSPSEARDLAERLLAAAGGAS